MNKDDGGPVHPTTTENGVYGPMHGMSLRDYFATHATEADIAAFLLATYTQKFEQVHGYDPTYGHHHAKSTGARQEAKFRYADAMIEARKK